jgi:hypothetical protein
MSPPRSTAATTSTSSKDPSKLSKGELLQLYKTVTAAKEDLSKKYGQYTRVSCGDATPMLHHAFNALPILGRAQKKYRRARRALEAGPDTPVSQDTIPYPTGETPGRGDLQLSIRLDIGKEEYNAFIVRDFTLFKFLADSAGQRRH